MSKRFSTIHNFYSKIKWKCIPWYSSNHEYCMYSEFATNFSPIITLLPILICMISSISHLFLEKWKSRFSKKKDINWLLLQISIICSSRYTCSTLYMLKILILVKLNKDRVSVNLSRGSNHGYAASKLTPQESTVHQVDRTSVICTSSKHVT